MSYTHIRTEYNDDKLQQRLTLVNHLTWYEHANKWDDCFVCGAQVCSKNKTHYRGHLPADLLIIGEPPTQSDDTLGRPYTEQPESEPIDEMLIQILEYCYQHSDVSLPDWCITSVVACKPIGPIKPIEENCHPRLLELISICQPKLIVIVGDRARQISARFTNVSIPVRTIKSPAWMLKQQNPELEIRKAALLLAPILVRLMEQTNVEHEGRKRNECSC